MRASTLCNRRPCWFTLQLLAIPRTHVHPLTHLSTVHRDLHFSSKGVQGFVDHGF